MNIFSHVDFWFASHFLCDYLCCSVYNFIYSFNCFLKFFYNLFHSYSSSSYKIFSLFYQFLFYSVFLSVLSISKFDVEYFAEDFFFQFFCFCIELCNFFYHNTFIFSRCFLCFVDFIYRINLVSLSDLFHSIFNTSWCHVFHSNSYIFRILLF